MNRAHLPSFKRKNIKKFDVNVTSLVVFLRGKTKTPTSAPTKGERQSDVKLNGIPTHPPVIACRKLDLNVGTTANLIAEFGKM